MFWTKCSSSKTWNLYHKINNKTLTWSSALASFIEPRFLSKLLIWSLRFFCRASVSFMSVSLAFFHSSRAWCSSFRVLHSFWLTVRLDFSSWLSDSKTDTLLHSLSSSCFCFWSSFWALQEKIFTMSDWQFEWQKEKVRKGFTFHVWLLHQKVFSSGAPAPVPRSESAAEV